MMLKSFRLTRGVSPNLSTLLALLYYAKGGQHHPFFFEGVKYYSIWLACSVRTSQMGDFGGKMLIIKCRVS